MSAALNGFNRLSAVYDPLKRLVFGDAIYRSAIHYLKEIPEGAKVLIIGGGTGEVLIALLRLNPSCEVWFIDASSEMLRRAQKRVSCFPDSTHFVHGTEWDIPEAIEFDALITDFFLDVFPGDELPAVCSQLAEALNPAGVWLVSDFVDSGKGWQRRFLAVMYGFFERLSGVRAKTLPPWQEQIMRSGWKEVASSMFYAGFIKSVVYRKLSVEGNALFPR